MASIGTIREIMRIEHGLHGHIHLPPSPQRSPEHIPTRIRTHEAGVSASDEIYYLFLVIRLFHMIFAYNNTAGIFGLARGSTPYNNSPTI